MESCTSFSSPRTDTFPAGLRVLVVDDDPTWLKILEKMLKKCSYEVTTCGLAREALDLLRERKDGFDIVISDVNMPDMDGFKLLEHVGLEMDLPVIMMSVDGETSRVMKGVQHGACDYLLKPIRMKELRNIWQHVFRKRIHEVRDIESHESIEDIHLLRSGLELLDEGFLFAGNDMISGKKRKVVESRNDDRESSDPTSVKKARVVWTVDLHQKFVKAVNQIGFDKVGPKKILDLMGIPWLTRENVASHLQKYRLYLGRLQKDNELKASYGGSCGTKPSDLPFKDSSSQNSVKAYRGDIHNADLGMLANKSFVQKSDSKTHEGEQKGVRILPADPNKDLFGDVLHRENGSSFSMGLNNTFLPVDSDRKYVPEVLTKYSWNSGLSHVQVKEEHKPRVRSEEEVNHLAGPGAQHHAIKIGRVRLCPSPLEKENYIPSTKIKPCYSQIRNQGDKDVYPIGTTADLSSIQSTEYCLTDSHSLEPIHSSTWNVKDDSLDLIIASNFGQRNLTSATGSMLVAWQEDFGGSFYEGDRPTSSSFESMGSLDHNDPELCAAAPQSILYDSLKFDYEFPIEPVDYPAIDQGLFIA